MIGRKLYKVEKVRSYGCADVKQGECRLVTMASDFAFRSRRQFPSIEAELQIQTNRNDLKVVLPIDLLSTMIMSVQLREKILRII